MKPPSSTIQIYTVQLEFSLTRTRGLLQFSLLEVRTGAAFRCGLVFYTDSRVGSHISFRVGSHFGSRVASHVGSRFGGHDGFRVGCHVGSIVGSHVGSIVGSHVGSRLGCLVGSRCGQDISTDGELDSALSSTQDVHHLTMAQPRYNHLIHLHDTSTYTKSVNTNRQRNRHKCVDITCTQIQKNNYFSTLWT